MTSLFSRVWMSRSFSPKPAHLAALGRWYTFAQNALTGFGELRVWPHHLDLGFWTPGDVDGRSIGGGLSPGDETHDQPYLYVNPYPVPEGGSAPLIPAPGKWQTEGFTGAVALGEDLVSLSDRKEGMLTFLVGSFEAVR